MKKIALVVFILVGLANYQYGMSLEQPLVNTLQNIDFNKEHPAIKGCLLYTSPSPRDRTRSRMPSSA